MAELIVSYTVPVSVVVDTDAGTVSRVVVEDEAATIVEDGPGQYEISFAEGGHGESPSVDERAKAVQIAENPPSGWPEWERGW